MPPQNISLKPVVKKVKGGKPRWVKFDNKLPEDSIIGGYENEVLYIMRAMHETALTPGKFVPSTGKGYVAWGMYAHEKSECEVNATIVTSEISHPYIKLMLFLSS